MQVANHSLQHILNGMSHFVGKTAKRLLFHFVRNRIPKNSRCHDRKFSIKFRLAILLKTSSKSRSREL